MIPWTRVLHNWPQKLGALVLAVLLWAFVSNDESNTAQRRLTVPLTLEGLQEDQLVVDVPDEIDVTVSGPSARVATLSAQSFTAYLDLQGSDGPFERYVRVIPPQGIELVRSEPREVYGTVETEVRRAVSVELALAGEWPTDTVVTAASNTRTVTAGGRAQDVARVAWAVATVRADTSGDNARLYPVAESGDIVEGVWLEPQHIAVAIQTETVLHEARVPILALPPEAGALQVENFALNQTDLRVAGSEQALADLGSIRVFTPLDTVPSQPGRYTTPARPELPDGVMALEPLSASFELRVPDFPAETDEPPASSDQGD